MKLIVGLGNPGKEYENTRHNIGFMIVDAYAKNNKFEIKKRKFNGLYSEISNGGEKAIFLKPQSYMNLSGEVIKKFVDFYKIDLCDILIINDDLDLKLGKIKLKKSGSSGGHNGLKNIELNLSTQEYKRLKIGISNDKSIDTKEYVLGKLNHEEIEVINKLMEITSDIIDDFLKIDFDTIMSKYNHK